MKITIEQPPGYTMGDKTDPTVRFIPQEPMDLFELGKCFGKVKMQFHTGHGPGGLGHGSDGVRYAEILQSDLIAAIQKSTI